MRRAIACGAAAWFVLSSLGCARTAHEGAATADPGPPWFVRIGSEGGFTGGGSGHVIHWDGTVQAWSRLTPGESLDVRLVGRSEAQQLRALLRAMTDPELLRLRQEETGNMTAFIEWSRGAERRRWSWAERIPGPALPPPLERAYLAALAAVAVAHQPRSGRDS